jgi:hypothetical protein
MREKERHVRVGQKRKKMWKWRRRLMSIKGQRRSRNDSRLWIGWTLFSFFS